MLCEHYWPADSTLVICGHITIHLLAKKPEDEWTKREFQLQHMHALRMSGGTGFRAEISEMVASPPGSLEPSLSEDHKHSATPREVVHSRSSKARDLNHSSARHPLYAEVTQEAREGPHGSESILRGET